MYDLLSRSQDIRGDLDGLLTTVAKIRDAQYAEDGDADPVIITVTLALQQLLREVDELVGMVDDRARGQSAQEEEEP